MRANSELLATPTNFSYLVRMREPRYYRDSNHRPKKQYHIIITTHAYLISLYYNLATFNIQHWFKSECNLSLYSYFVSVPDDLPVPVPAPES